MTLQSNLPEDEILALVTHDVLKRIGEGMEAERVISAREISSIGRFMHDSSLTLEDCLEGRAGMIVKQAAKAVSKNLALH
jgi:hypothetical protein